MYLFFLMTQIEAAGTKTGNPDKDGWVVLTPFGEHYVRAMRNLNDEQFNRVNRTIIDGLF